MKRYILAVLIILAVIGASGCIGQNGTGSGNVINQSRNVSGFNQVSLDGIGTVIITQGNQESLSVEAEDNVMPHITTNVSNNKLNIGYDRSVPAPTKPVIFHLTVKDLNTIDIRGAGKIQSDSFKANSLTINMDGAGETNLANFNANTLKVLMSGAGRLFLSGNANNQYITISGAGEYTGGNLTSKIATITMDGAGRATVKVSDTLNIKINGAGQVSYIGNPKITQSISGAGSVNKISG